MPPTAAAGAAPERDVPAARAARTPARCRPPKGHRPEGTTGAPAHRAPGAAIHRWPPPVRQPSGTYRPRPCPPCGGPGRRRCTERSPARSPPPAPAAAPHPRRTPWPFACGRGARAPSTASPARHGPGDVPPRAVPADRRPRPWAPARDRRARNPPRRPPGPPRRAPSAAAGRLGGRSARPSAESSSRARPPVGREWRRPARCHVAVVKGPTLDG